MNCCPHKTGPGVERTTPARVAGCARATKAAGSVVTGAILVLLPKCPLCIAAWVAAGTGVAVPTILADSVRPVLALLCAVSVLLLVRRWRVV